MRRRVASLILAATISLGTAGLVSGCGNAAPPMPASLVVTYGNTCYAPYEYTSYELNMYGLNRIGACQPIEFPSISMQPPSGTLAYALWRHRTTYSSFYDSGYWYDTYYAPTASRYHVTVISRTSYLNTSRTFTTTYSSAIKTNSAKGKWSNGKTGSYRFPASNGKLSNSSNRNYNSNTGNGGFSGKTGNSQSGSSSNLYRGSSTGKTGGSRYK
ncbi:MAG TPA: hypothetical protein VIY48_14030 [Candidatus Paceibacterota bacterium]